MTEKKELWKDIMGYEGIYQVSNKGRIRSLDRIAENGKRRKGKILNNIYTRKGYTINLSKGERQRYKVSRIVYMTHCRIIHASEVIRYRDGDMKNLNIENLYAQNREELNREAKQYKKVNKKNKYRGVAENPYGFQVSVGMDNKIIYIGYYKTAEEGAKAYDEYVEKNKKNPITNKSLGLI